MKVWEFIFTDDNQTSKDSYSGVLRIIAPIEHRSFSISMQFELELNGIPVSDDNQGKDVTVNWRFRDFEMNNTFWTDSNGLEMQQRILNHRPSFNYSGVQNISSNYYPVGSAIAIRDFDANGTVRKQATVLNDRS